MRHHLLILLLLVYGSVAAQSGYRSAFQDYYMANSIEDRRFLQRISLSIGKQFINGKGNLQFMGFADSSAYRQDSFEVSLKARPSYIIHLGSYLPIAIVSDNSMLVLNIELMASLSTITYDSVALSSRAKFCIPFDAIRGGVPLSVEYRMGGDVRLNKNHKSCFGIGAGVNPSMVNANDYNRNTPIKITPFLKIEAGFFAGLAFKLRGMVNFGEMEYNYADDYNVAGYTNNKVTTRMKGSNGYSLSLAIMPFSYMWTR